MLKSSSLCLHSSNLGTFWLKIEQFWPFEEISIFSNSGHLERRAGLSDTILKWRPSWLEVGINGHNFERGPSKDHSTKVWLQLAQWFLRRKLKCEMLTDGRRTTDDGRKVMTVAHLAGQVS